MTSSELASTQKRRPQSESALARPGGASVLVALLASALFGAVVLANDLNPSPIQTHMNGEVLPSSSETRSNGGMDATTSFNSGGSKPVDWIERVNDVGTRFLSSLIPISGASNDLRRDRWTYVPTQTHETRDRYRFPATRVGPLTRIVNRIRQRIGSRNSIRVHNAFRDFAWRLLSRLSMPTPVIYELRRQNFYPLEDDLMNDSLHDKNTTRTIRTRRNLWSTLLQKHRHARADDYEDEEEPENR